MIHRQNNYLKNNINIWLILLVFIAVIVAYFSVLFSFFIVFGMLPGFVAAVVDNYKKRSLTKIVYALNIAGLSPYIINILFNFSQIHEIALNYILAAKVWLYIYLHCLIGWIIYWIMPTFFLLIENIMVARCKIKLNKELRLLLDEWELEDKK